MKILKAETVVRYQVLFIPSETAVLARHDKWRHRIGIRPSGHGSPRFGDAMLTKAEINDVCDALGVNGREFMAGLPEMDAPSSRDVSLDIARTVTDAGLPCQFGGEE